MPGFHTQATPLTPDPNPHLMMTRHPCHCPDQVIVLSELLPGSVAYEGYEAELGADSLRRLHSVNGIRVVNMTQLTALVVYLTHTGSTGRGGTGQGPSAGRGSAGATGPDPGSASDAESGSSSSDASHEPPVSAAAASGRLRLEFSDGAMVIIDLASAKRDTLAAMAQHGIPHALSARLRAHLAAEMPGAFRTAASMWPRDPTPAADAGMEGPMQQRRQRRRRLALRR